MFVLFKVFLQVLSLKANKKAHDESQHMLSMEKKKKKKKGTREEKKKKKLKTKPSYLGGIWVLNKETALLHMSIFPSRLVKTFLGMMRRKAQCCDRSGRRRMPGQQSEEQNLLPLAPNTLSVIACHHQ